MKNLKQGQASEDFFNTKNPGHKHENILGKLEILILYILATKSTKAICLLTLSCTSKFRPMHDLEPKKEKKKPKIES